MVTEDGARALVARARATGLRADTGPAPAPRAGSHVVVLVKPEVMTADHAADALAEAVRVLGRGEVDVLRGAVVPAADFAGRGYLLLHYPRLHRVAADGSRALCSGAREELGALLATSGTGGAVGAYEAMTREAGLSPAALDERCRTAGIRKLGSGSYASVTELNGRPATVLNGFLPSLAAGYAAPGTLVGLLECHSLREIDELRGGLLGPLDPVGAPRESLRGALGALAREHGTALSEGRNAVHLSAGHLEGMFQAWRYFTAADGEDVGGTAFGRSLADRGVSPAEVAALAADHNLAEDSGETVSPHGATENLPRAAALDRVLRWAATGKGLGT
ncbi:hypothetical protein [Streptomyces albireticuli]|uniref:Nucleoside-diphosphate kinase n=1 Tax=Streptomyces albireticuli TaxID=1940 RepID=A0A2A2DHN2_9ACTN|nr:hypothetical protein [Streptomyces albireticuli]MCD9195207.1 hypothetical protein [Streptomyces albireticuli]PAU50762.1 hypothetical protein CK936_00835 [Streptomyces albireticuli]